MAQTTNAITFKDCLVSLSTDNITYNDVSGYSATVEVGGGERETGEAFTFDGDTPILSAGKRGALEIKMKFVYTEAGTNYPFATLLAAYEAGSKLYAKWQPKGAGVGNFIYTTGGGYVTVPPYPGGEAESADPIVIETTLKVPTVTKTAQV